MPAINKLEDAFLFKAMDKHIKEKQVSRMAALPEETSGQMSIPQPIVINSNADMDVEVYKKCSLLISVFINMMQKSIIAAAATAGIPADTGLKNIDAWFKAFLEFPLPVFNFVDSQRQNEKRNDFNIKADLSIIDSILNIKNIGNLRDAVLKALQDVGNSADLISYSKTDKDFKYFGVITHYSTTDISVRVVDFTMRMKNTDVKILCGGTGRTKLDSYYYTYSFSANQQLISRLADKFGDEIVDYISSELDTFLNTYYDSHAQNSQSLINDVFSK